MLPTPPPDALHPRGLPPAGASPSPVPAALGVLTQLPAPYPWAQHHPHVDPYRYASGPKPAVATRVSRPRPFGLRELAVTLAFAVAVDVLLWGPPSDLRAEGLRIGGISVALVLVAVPLLAYFAPRRVRHTPRLAVGALAIGLVAVRAIVQPSPGLVLAGVILCAAFLAGLRTRRPNVPDALVAAVLSAVHLPREIANLGRGLRAAAARSRYGRLDRARLLSVAVPAGLVLVFAGVFALANPIVAEALGVAARATIGWITLPAPVRITLWCVAFAAAVGLIRPAVRLPRGREAAPAEGSASPVALRIAGNTLLGLNLLFFAYNALDGRYLWLGSPPTGIDTQHDAHASAFWLTVALLLVTLVVGIMFRGPLAHDARGQRVRSLAFLWLLQAGVLGLGTYRRLAIHVAASGLSDLRIVGIFGTTLVLAGVALVALKLRRQRTFTWLWRRQLEALVAAWTLYALLPTHLISAGVNVARIMDGETRPILHVFRQARETESAAAFVPLLDHPDPVVRRGIAAVLAETRDTLRETMARRTSVREFDLATPRALAVLDRESPRIDGLLEGVDREAARRTLFGFVREGYLR